MHVLKILNISFPYFETKTTTGNRVNFLSFFLFKVHQYILVFIYPEILCKKLIFYGFEVKTIAWFNSFLIGRSQCVKIGDKISSRKQLLSGVPQGGILSPLAFVIYVSDLCDWLKCSVAGTYADDTQSSCTNKELSIVKKNLESDALQVLLFMASNGLIANPKKKLPFYSSI